jgi:hypothetical protein
MIKGMKGKIEILLKKRKRIMVDKKKYNKWKKI